MKRMMAMKQMTSKKKLTMKRMMAMKEMTSEKNEETQDFM